MMEGKVMMMFLVLLFGLGIIVAPIIVWIKTEGQERRVLKALASSIACFILMGICAVNTDTSTQPTQTTQEQQMEAQRQKAISLIRMVDIFQQKEEEVLSKGDIVALYDFYKDWEESWLNLDTIGWNEDLKLVKTKAWVYCEKAQKCLEDINNVKAASDLREARENFDNAWCNVIYNYVITPEDLGVSE